MPIDGSVRAVNLLPPDMAGASKASGDLGARPEATGGAGPFVVLGVLAAWAETPKQAALVVGVLALFVIPLPLLGHGPLSGTGPLRVVLVNTDVLAFVALLALLPFRGRVTLSRR